MGAWRRILAPGCSSSGQLTQDFDQVTPYTVKRASQVAQWSRIHLTIQETWVQSLGLEKISWRRKWQPILVFLPGESHGQGSLADYSLWGFKGSDMTE